MHVDYAGPFEGKYWLVVIDAYSKWLEIKECQTTTAAVTIKLLREMFCRLGVPKLIVSDNGPQFASLEFKHFCISNNVTHVRSTPYHPKTNGLAERAVRTFKERVTMSRQHTEDLELRVQKFLISYRNTPQKSTNRAPSELLMGRRLRTKLDLLKPDTSNTMDKALVKQKLYHDRGAKPRWFFEGESVWVQKTNDKGYEAGKIVKRQTDHSYLVMIQGIVRLKNADQLRLKSDTSTCTSNGDENEQTECESQSQLHPRPEGSVEPRPLRLEHRESDASESTQSGTRDTQSSRLEAGLGQDQVETEPTGSAGVSQAEAESLTGSTVNNDLQGIGGERGEDENTGSQRTRPTRTRKPPVRPYDKYLQFPGAK